MALTYQFQPSDTDSGFVDCATVRNEVSVILSHPVHGNYLQQPQKTDTFPTVFPYHILLNRNAMPSRFSHV